MGSTLSAALAAQDGRAGAPHVVQPDPDEDNRRNEPPAGGQHEQRDNPCRHPHQADHREQQRGRGPATDLEGLRRIEAASSRSRRRLPVRSRAREAARSARGASPARPGFGHFPAGYSSPLPRELTCRAGSAR